MAVTKTTSRTIINAPTSNSEAAIRYSFDQIAKRVQETQNINEGDSVGSVQQVFTLEVTAAATVAGESELTLNGTVNNVPLTASDISTNTDEIEGFVNGLGNYTAENTGLPEIFTLQVTAAPTATGEAVLTINGTAYNVPLESGKTIDETAAAIQAFIANNVATHTATVATDTVTVTSNSPGDETDATFAAGTATAVAGTVVVTQDGTDLLTITALEGGVQSAPVYAAGTATTSAATLVVTVTGVDGTASPVVVAGRTAHEAFKFDVVKGGIKYTATYVETLPNNQ